MLSLRENMILIDGLIRTCQIDRCSLNANGDRYHIAFKNKPSKTYSYGLNKVMWLTDPILLNPDQTHIYHNGSLLHALAFIAVFQLREHKYWYVEFQNGAHKSFINTEISIVESCLNNKQSKTVFEYLRSIATINPLRAEEDDTPLLLKQYQKIDFIGEDRAVAPYFNPERLQLKQLNHDGHLIYPFGCNASQQKAVQAAFENQISIIQGPPGTGKTQTILNIVANIIRQGKSVMVVSNNNSAIANIVEKMERHDMGFITALLGCRKNKEAFIANQETEKAIPKNIKQWHSAEADQPSYLKNISSQAIALADVFVKQERQALASQELNALKVERTHFEQEMVHTQLFSIRKQLSSSQLMELWNELQSAVERTRYSGIFAKWINAFRDYWFNRKLHKIFAGIPKKTSLEDITTLIPIIQHQFYETKESELTDEINALEQDLASCNARQMMKQLQKDSMCYLRNILYHKYGKEHERPIFTIRSKGEEIIKEYPVILSTTFSSYTNFSQETVLDYVLMDEASQISADTGALALMCARNAVIVGDSKQLPNVVTEKDKLQLQAIAINYNIDERYNCAHHSFLQSVCRVLPNAPQTLLREHYRCHPKIINFCNLKFYGGKLIIMTKDNGEEDVISAKRTVTGNHSRENINQRQIDVIAQEVLPALQYANVEIGVVAPYNKQVNALNHTLGNNIDVATVHKFQGREKDAIVMSTVDDYINEFSDDPNLLNVAVSRAKKKFCLIVSGNKQPKDGNISDLLAYIEYNNCTITDSNIHSIFDLLYNQYTQARILYLKKHKRISEYDSENLTYAMLEQITEENPEFNHLGIVCHHPLRLLIRHTSLLTDEELLYAMHPKTHIDFLLYNRVSKQPVLAIETDGYSFHHAATIQYQRDEKKNRIFAALGIPLLRLSTTGSNEEQKVINALKNGMLT